MYIVSVAGTGNYGNELLYLNYRLITKTKNISGMYVYCDALFQYDLFTCIEVRSSCNVTKHVLDYLVFKLTFRYITSILGSWDLDYLRN
jgi:hypothetical protein